MQTRITANTDIFHAVYIFLEKYGFSYKFNCFACQNSNEKQISYQIVMKASGMVLYK